MSRLITSLLFGFAVVAMAPAALADTIMAVFSDPVLSGSVVNPSSPGKTQFADYTGTAVYSITDSKMRSSLRWGVSPRIEPYQTYSQLVLVGGTIPSDTSNPFELASLTYTNGTSQTNTEIFGATISFYDNVISPGTLLGSDQLTITNTRNVFGVAGGLSNGDDDYITICGNGSNICTTSIEAVEASEGGTSVTVALFGSFTGKGNSGPGAATPEPGSFSLLLTGGLAGSAWLWKRRRSA